MVTLLVKPELFDFGGFFFSSIMQALTEAHSVAVARSQLWRGQRCVTSLEDAPTLYFVFISSWRLVPGRLLSGIVLLLKLGSEAHLSSWEWDEE